MPFRQRRIGGNGAMDRRSTHTPFSSVRSAPESQVLRFAKELGWPLGRRNVLVEGTRDVELLELAATLHAKKTREELLGDDLRVVAAGYGEMGGVGAVERRFITIHELGQLDRELPKKERIRLLPLFDDDKAGRATFQSITQRRHPFREYVDVFLLKRRYPPVRPGSPAYIDELKKVNREWHNMDCEIEDLIGGEFLRVFCDEHPGALRCPAVINGDGHHREWTDDGKAKLHRFVRDHALLEDLAELVRLLKYVRWIFDLPNGHAG